MDHSGVAQRIGPGERFGHYELRAVLGRGGMGNVYEAHDTVKDRTVALKLLHAELARNPAYRERFRRESHAAARLQEPHVIPIHDWGEIDGTVFIDMRLVDGVDLRTLIQSQGPVPPARAVAIVDQIASALDAAHEAGLVHRDVKPENILLAPGDFAYLADFGIAQTVSDPKLTVTGSAVGSHAYMAPERFEEGGAVGPVADVYALACVLYELLVGAAPFPASTIGSVVRAHLMSDPPRASARSAAPAALDAVILRGMAKDPAQRYPTAGDFAREAFAALTAADRRAAERAAAAVVAAMSDPANRVVRPAAPMLGSTTDVGVRPVRPTPVPAPPGPLPARPRRLPAVLLTMMLLTGILAVFGWLLSARGVSGERSASGPVPARAAAPGAATAAVTASRSAGPVPLVGAVSGTDQQGFLSAGARCDGSDTAMVMGRTTGSTVVVCAGAGGRTYYLGYRTSDGAKILLDYPTPDGDGYTVINPADGVTRYRLNSSGLVVSRGSSVVTDEQMVEYTHR
ncbi:serine/threonine-protein kinase [Skermania piniformis]|uniref:serine/threonine-protein kinase n=1 Tax=Skermania pinensis TaxID=39122 RepID=UPI000A4F0303|nr:serine/threonine-protein kinase [Skermania piniformis]